MSSVVSGIFMSVVCIQMLAWKPFSLTCVCIIGLFKAAAAARRRFFNESLYGVCPMGVPEASLTSCERTFSGQCFTVPPAL